jgi:hypothetical protein
MHLLLESPDHFQKLTKQIIDDKVEEETSKWVARTLRRGMAREYQADPSVGIGTVASGAAGSLFDETSKLIKTGVSKTMK